MRLFERMGFHGPIVTHTYGHNGGQHMYADRCGFARCEIMEQNAPERVNAACGVAGDRGGHPKTIVSCVNNR